MHRARMRIYLVCMSLACLDGTSLQPPPCTSSSAMRVDCMPASTRLQQTQAVATLCTRTPANSLALS